MITIFRRLVARVSNVYGGMDKCVERESNKDIKRIGGGIGQRIGMPGRWAFANQAEDDAGEGRRKLWSRMDCVEFLSNQSADVLLNLGINPTPCSPPPWRYY